MLKWVKKLVLEKKREHIKDLVKFLDEKHSTMSDFIENLRDLTNLVSNTDSDRKGGGGVIQWDTKEGTSVRGS